jgi:uncharacterized protein YndB with AHSA1/START domain
MSSSPLETTINARARSSVATETSGKQPTTPAKPRPLTVTIDFHDLGDGTTEIVLTQERLRDEASRDSHAGGWTQVFEKLAEFLASA